MAEELNDRGEGRGVDKRRIGVVPSYGERRFVEGEREAWFVEGERRRVLYSRKDEERRRLFEEFEGSLSASIKKLAEASEGFKKFAGVVGDVGRGFREVQGGVVRFGSKLRSEVFGSFKKGLRDLYRQVSQFERGLKVVGEGVVGLERGLVFGKEKVGEVVREGLSEGLREGLRDVGREASKDFVGLLFSGFFGESKERIFERLTERSFDRLRGFDDLVGYRLKERLDEVERVLERVKVGEESEEVLRRRFEELLREFSKLRSEVFGSFKRSLQDLYKQVSPSERGLKVVGEGVVGLERSKISDEVLMGMWGLFERVEGVVSGMGDRLERSLVFGKEKIERVVKGLKDIGKEVSKDFAGLLFSGFFGEFGERIFERLTKRSAGRATERDFNRLKDFDRLRGFDDLVGYRLKERLDEVERVLERVKVGEESEEVLRRRFEELLKEFSKLRSGVFGEDLKKLQQELKSADLERLKDLVRSLRLCLYEVEDSEWLKGLRDVRRRLGGVSEREREKGGFGVISPMVISELVQEPGAKILTDKLFIQVKEGVRIEGLDVGGRGGLFDYVLDLFGLRGGVGRFGGVVGRVGGMLGRVTLPLLSSKFLRFGGLLGGLGFLSYEVFSGIRRKGLKEGVLSFLLGEEGAGRFRRAVDGVVKGAVLGGLLGSVIPGLGTVLGSVVGGVVGVVSHLFGDEVRRVGSFLIERFSDLSKMLIKQFSDLKEKISERFSSLFQSVLSFFGRVGGVLKEGGRKIVEFSAKGIEGVREFGSRVVELAKQGVSGFVSMVGEIGVKRAEAAVRSEEGMVRALMTVQAGGKALGPFQMEPETFRRFAERYGYWGELKEYQYLSKEWMQAWEGIIRREGAQRVFEQMREYIMKTHYEPLVRGLGEVGKVLVEKGVAMREALFSIAVQYGPGLGKKLVMEAFGRYGVEQLRQMTEEQLIDVLMDVKKRTIPKYFPRFPNMWAGLERRVEEERARLRAIVEAERRGKERMWKEVGRRKVEREGRVEAQGVEREGRVEVRGEERIGLRDYERKFRVRDVTVEKERENLQRGLSEMLKSDIELKRNLVPVVEREGESVKGGEGGGVVVPQFFDIEKIPVSVEDVGILLIQLGLV